MFWIIIAWLAVIFTATQFIPQALKAVVSRKLADISLGTFVMVLFTASFWILHGIHRSDIAIIVANTLAFITAVVIVTLKIMHRE